MASGLSSFIPKCIFSISFLVATSTASLASRSLDFSTIKYVFGFGDSYTQTGYDPTQGVLSPDPVATSSDGPMYLHFLTYDYNQSDINQNSSRVPLFNFGHGRATVNNSIVNASRTGIPSLVDQADTFNRYFKPAPQEAPWLPSDALFTFWFGINDVQNSWRAQNGNGSTTYTAIATSYVNTLSDLSDAGASKFIIFKLPPFDRSPQYSNRTTYSAQNASTVASLIQQYNSILEHHILGFATAHPEAQVVLYDMYTTFGNLLNTGCTSLGFKVCDATCYPSPEPDWNPYDNRYYCNGSLPDYFWVDGLHPTWAVHQLISQNMRQNLF